MKKELIKLPDVTGSSGDLLARLTAALSLPRELLAADDEIAHAWQSLPRVIGGIPKDKLTAQHARLCVAVAAGLFDAAVNYAWNSSVVALREKVRGFGLSVVAQITRKPFEEETLGDLKDSELLDLCLSLNLVDEEAHFFLNQCREVRNNFSSAHPPTGTLDDHELLAFLNRCVKYALGSGTNPKGVDTQAFLAALKAGKFSVTQTSKWIERLGATHNSQRDFIFAMLHGVFCDPNSSEETRVNCLDICKGFSQTFSDKTKSELINRHNEYVAEGKVDRQKASRTFFTKLGIFALLSDMERHGLISRVCQRLLAVHNEFNNFYNEPPFADQLAELAGQGALPETVQPEYVEAVVICAVGNPWGFSRGATSAYEKMIRNFSPREIGLMLEAPKTSVVLGKRMANNPNCTARYRELVALLDRQSVPTAQRAEYKSWLAKAKGGA